MPTILNYKAFKNAAGTALTYLKKTKRERKREIALLERKGIKGQGIFRRK